MPMREENLHKLSHGLLWNWSRLPRRAAGDVPDMLVDVPMRENLLQRWQPRVGKLLDRRMRTQDLRSRQLLGQVLRMLPAPVLDARSVLRALFERVLHKVRSKLGRRIPLPKLLKACLVLGMLLPRCDNSEVVDCSCGESKICNSLSLRAAAALNV